jgi:hypothetical protein
MFYVSTDREKSKSGKISQTEISWEKTYGPIPPSESRRGATNSNWKMNLMNFQNVFESVASGEYPRQFLALLSE